MTIRERIEGALWGLLVGDALGVPYEFHPEREIPPRDEIEMNPPPGFRRAHAGTPVGTWSDDGAQALCLLASLLESGSLDLDDFGERLVRWCEDGYMTVDGRVFDVGIGTAAALRRISGGVAPHEAGGTGERENGNGSLMRVMPLVLWHQGSDEELIRDAHHQSLPTHRHPRSLVCCALYCLWGRRVLEGEPRAWELAIAQLEAHYADDETMLGELDFHVRPREVYEPKGTGYVVDCLRSAQMVTTASDYETTIKAAVALGNDTDTTACVAGGIAGLQHGVDAIPDRWLSLLRGKELVEPLLDRLVERAG